MANKGYFIITDISGYTEFLTESELEHAHKALQNLFDAQLKTIRFPLKVSGFRGDAIFMYTPEACFVHPQTFLELLENLYVVFADTNRQMQFNTTCPCKACKNIHKLDLKMCVHYGEYIVQYLGDREELLGADVIVPHRMLKNAVIEKTGVKSYALFTDAAAQSLRLSELSQPLIAHTENYEHLGEVKMHIFDLSAVWKNVQDKERRMVTQEEAWVQYEVDLPYPAPLIWEYLTTPALEARVLGLDTVKRTDALGGRVRENAGYHCAHGEMNFYAKIVDWKPFDYYTFSQIAEPFGNVEYLQMRRLIPLENGTRLQVNLSKPEIGATDEIREQLQGMGEIFGNVRAVIEEDIASGTIIVN